MKPAQALKAALKATPPAGLDVLEAAGFERRLIKRAALGQQVNASVHLQLCARLGIDPVTGEAAPPREIGPLHMPSLSAALRMKRFPAKLSLRAAARKARASYSALGRIERGEPVSITAILAACAWLGRHPFDFVSPRVSRETRSAA
jgi:hypothetical protein